MKSSQPSSDETVAVFRFVGDAVNPSMITSQIGIKPTEAHFKGGVVEKHPHRNHPTGYWGLSSVLPAEHSLEEHIKYLLDTLQHHISTIKEIGDTGVVPSFFCGFFTSRNDFGSSLKLNADTLAQIAQMGASLEIHVYRDD